MPLNELYLFVVSSPLSYLYAIYSVSSKIFLHVNPCEFELECIHACLGFLHAGNIHHKSFQYARLSTIRHSLLQFSFFLLSIGSFSMRKLHRDENKKKFPGKTMNKNSYWVENCLEKNLLCQAVPSRSECRIAIRLIYLFMLF